MADKSKVRASLTKLAASVGSVSTALVLVPMLDSNRSDALNAKLDEIQSTMDSMSSQCLQLTSDLKALTGRGNPSGVSQDVTVTSGDPFGLSSW
jgi:hypothetical protein